MQHISLNPLASGLIKGIYSMCPICLLYLTVQLLPSASFYSMCPIISRIIEIFYRFIYEIVKNFDIKSGFIFFKSLKIYEYCSEYE